MKAFVVLSLLLFAPILASAQQPPTYYVADDEVSAKILVLSPSGDSKDLSIVRSFVNSKEERLLSIAEATYPPRAEVLRATRRKLELYARPLSDKNLWWCDAFDGVLIPYAITKGAINYYITVIEEFHKGDYSRTKGIKMFGTLKYAGNIKHQDSYQVGKEEFKDVFVVSMQLAWRQYCGLTCSMNFDTDRIVVMDSKGNVLYVSGDKCADGPVS